MRNNLDNYFQQSLVALANLQKRNERLEKMGGNVCIVERALVLEIDLKNIPKKTYFSFLATFAADD